MTATTLLALFDAVYLVAMTAWVGAILFFSFGVAPIIFGTLGAEAGGRFVRALFPRYYAWGAIGAAVALAAFVCGRLAVPELRGWGVLVQAGLLIGCALAMLYAGNGLTPAINAARDAGPAEAARFDRLHKRSVRLNGLVLAIGLGLLVAFAFRPSPTTAGLVEPPVNELVDQHLKRQSESIRIGRPPRPAAP